MSTILPAEKMHTILKDYYKENFGERETDVWYECSAVNVLVFSRDGKLITLQCHIFNGEVTERSRSME